MYVLYFTVSDKACENSLNHLDPVLAQVAELQSGTAVYVLKPSFYQQVKVLSSKMCTCCHMFYRLKPFLNILSQRDRLLEGPVKVTIFSD